MDGLETAEPTRIAHPLGRTFTDLGMNFPPHNSADPLRNAATTPTVTRLPIAFAVVDELWPGACLRQISFLPARGTQGIGTGTLSAVLDRACAGDNPRPALPTFHDIPCNGT